MAFLNNSKFLEIRNAAKNGNVEAKEILQALMKGESQDNINRMTNSYYKIPSEEEPKTIGRVEKEEMQAEEPLPEALEKNIENDNYDIYEGQDMEEAIEEQEEQEEQEEEEEEVEEVEKLSEEPEPVPTPEVEDLTELLDKDTDGLFDENEIEDKSFGEFLKKKHSDGLRARKDSEYFKAYNPEGKKAYLDQKKKAYGDKFSNRLKGIDRNFRDLDNSLGMYSQSVNEMLDDENELDMTKAGEAYDLMTGNDDMMMGLSRSFDENDAAEVKEKLQEMVNMYGKKNIIAALNTLRSDNGNYRDYRKNAINSEIERYGKNIDKILG